MSFPKRSTFRMVYEALIAGLDGAPLSDGTFLTARATPDQPETISDDNLPYLLFDVGAMAFSPWSAWEELDTWEVPARLKVKSSPGETDNAVLDVLWDLTLRIKSIIGLPIDETGAIVPFSNKTAAMFDGDSPELMFLAQRGAPVIKSFKAQASKGPYIDADIVFGVKAVFDFDPRVLGRLEKAVLGVGPVAPGQVLDTTMPNGLRTARLIGDADRLAVLAASGDAPDFGSVTVSPLFTQQPNVKAKSAAETVRGVNATPYSAALSAGAPTQQLSAIATYANWRTVYITSQAAWATTDALVATVNSAGLVTRTGVGSCSISCTFDGAASNAVAVTCS